MEFHAIILCGSGRRLNPLNSIAGSGLSKQSIPKALMPIGDKPALAHSLSWCERGGFSDITVVCTNDSLAEIKNYVETKYPNDRKSLTTSTHVKIDNIEVAGVESQNTESLIPLLKTRIKRDFVAMSSDFITDVEPETLLDYHRNRNHDTIITGIYYKNNIEALDKKVLKPDMLIHTAFKNKSPLLLDWYSRDQVTAKKFLSLRDAMIIRHANSVISTKILHSSISFCSHKLIDILVSYDDNDDSDDDKDEKPEKPLHPVPTRGRPWNKVVRDIARRSWQHSKPLDSVAIALVDDDKTFIRVENLPSYMEANRWAMKQKAKAAGSVRPTQAKGAAIIGADSCVGTDTTVGERTSVKKTVVGNNCTLGKRCRLTGSVILDGVKIADDVTLENCLIGKNAVINSKCRLVHCIIEGGYVIAKDTEAKDEKFEGFELDDAEDGDFNMESSEDDDSDDDGSDSEGSEYSNGRGEAYDDDDGFFDRS